MVFLSFTLMRARDAGSVFHLAVLVLSITNDQSVQYIARVQFAGLLAAALASTTVLDSELVGVPALVLAFVLVLGPVRTVLAMTAVFALPALLGVVRSCS